MGTLCRGDGVQNPSDISVTATEGHPQLRPKTIRHRRTEGLWSPRVRGATSEICNVNFCLSISQDFDSCGNSSMLKPPHSVNLSVRAIKNCGKPSDLGLERGRLPPKFVRHKGNRGSEGTLLSACPPAKIV